jgi:hypothetical protein
MGNRKSRKIGGGGIIYFFDYGMSGMRDYPNHASLDPKPYKTPMGRSVGPSYMSTGTETLGKASSSDWVDSYNKSIQKKDMYDRLSQEGFYIRPYKPPTGAEGKATSPEEFTPVVETDPITGEKSALIGGKKSKRKTSKRRKTNKRR